MPETMHNLFFPRLVRDRAAHGLAGSHELCYGRGSLTQQRMNLLAARRFPSRARRFAPTQVGGVGEGVGALPPTGPCPPHRTPLGQTLWSRASPRAPVGPKSSVAGCSTRLDSAVRQFTGTVSVNGNKTKGRPLTLTQKRVAGEPSSCEPAKRSLLMGVAGDGAFRC